MKTRSAPPHGIKAAETSFDIVESIKERNGATLAELTRDVDVTKSTIHSHLSTLIHRGYVRKEDGEYFLGLLFFDLGSHARNYRQPITFVKSGIKRLAEETHERTQFAVEEYGLGYALYREQGSHAVETGRRIGKPMYIHDNAAGKAILSQLPRGRVDEIIDHWGLPATTENTITEPTDLYEELETIRSTSLSYNRGESRANLRAIATPVTTGDHVFGAISVAGPQHRIRGDKQETVEDLLLGIVNEIELNLGDE